MRKIIAIIGMVMGIMLVAHADMNQPNSSSIPGETQNPGIMDNGNPGITPDPDNDKPAQDKDQNNQQDDNSDDVDSITDPGSEGDLDSNDATTPTAQPS